MLGVELAGWATRHGVTAAALADLAHLLGAEAHPAGTGSEAFAQSEIRLAAPSLQMRLFRNNVGVLQNADGRPVRYGLANDSKALNAKLKSGDLVGWRRLLVTAAMVGRTVAQFASIECKPPGWSYRGDAHEQAQQRWAALVTTEGGIGRFATSAAELDDAVNRT